MGTLDFLISHAVCSPADLCDRSLKRTTNDAQIYCTHAHGTVDPRCNCYDSNGQMISRFPVDDNCVLKLEGPTAAFDAAHDKDTEGGASLFCRLGVTATQALRAISDFKTAVSEPDKVSTNSILSFPLEVVIPHRTAARVQRRIPTVMIRTRKQWAGFVRHKLNQKQLAAIESAKLSDMSIVNSRTAGPGFILGDGLVFFSTRNESRITVWHLNSEVLGH